MIRHPSIATLTMDKHNHYRSQKKGQNARQAMMISGLDTIYRNNTTTHFIQTKQQTEPRIYLLDITLKDINARYSKIHQIIENGRLRPKGTELFFVDKTLCHFIITQDAMYEIRVNHHSGTREQCLYEIHPVDGNVRTMEITNTRLQTPVPLLIDESYYELNTTADTTRQTISTYNTVIRYVKKVIRTHPKSMNAFVFIFNEKETDILDFYITTENGVISHSDIITRTCADDILSFIQHFKLCS